eukprot:4475131-Heterocapsa_arctica.AAC.1
MPFNCDHHGPGRVLGRDCSKRLARPPAPGRSGTGRRCRRGSPSARARGRASAPPPAARGR